MAILSGLLQVALYVTVCAAAVRSRVLCPDMPVQSDFDVRKIAGEWYEYERYPVFFEDEFVCSHMNFSVKPSGHVGLEVKGYDTNLNKTITVVGDGVPDSSEPAKMKMKFIEVEPIIAFWILDTDYENYVLAWSCTDFDFFNIMFSWILTAKRGVMDSRTERRLRQLLAAHHGEPDRFFKVPQSNCTFSFQT